MSITNQIRPDTQLSRPRLQTIIGLRWIAVLGQFLAIVVTYGILSIKLPILSCLVMVTLSGLLNLWLTSRYPARFRLSHTFATTLLTYDLLQLAALLFLTGGLENPFAFLMIAPVTVSAATLPARHTLFLAGIALAAASALLFFHLPLPWWSGRSFDLPLEYTVGLWTSVMCGMAFIGLYTRRLAREARQMSDALAATEHVLAREQQLHALDGLAAAAAHELGTPLATIAVVARELERALPADGANAEDLALLKSQTQRCREILTSLTTMGDEDDPLHAHLPLTHLIDEAVEPYRVFEKTINVMIQPEQGGSDAATSEPVSTRSPGVLHGLSNLIENATDFANSTVEVTAAWTDQTVSIVIADDGPGFSQTMLESLGEPYLTSRPLSARLLGKGTVEHAGLGLGFFIASTLLERSGAEITISNRVAPAKGAHVRVVWPRQVFENAPERPISETNGTETVVH
ncbi:MAG: ActS/PrrB/RegB family redox-sensitive histidine kinase [Methyloligellaceae bacterium]